MTIYQQTLFSEIKLRVVKPKPKIFNFGNEFKNGYSSGVNIQQVNCHLSS